MSNRENNPDSLLNKILDNCRNFEEIPKHLSAFTKHYLQEFHPSVKPSALDEGRVLKGINRICRKMEDDIKARKDKNESADLASGHEENFSATKEAREDAKRNIKNFVIYQIYKVMNPRRIAGETARDNYAHNMHVGGKRLADKHTGGNPREVAGYSENFKQSLQKSVRNFKKPDGWGR